MKQRPASRLLIIDPSGHVLLFKFTHRTDALAGSSYWATPGGGVEAGETFEQAAIRELREETGIARSSVGGCIAQRNFVMTLPNGEWVEAQEQFYIVRVTSHDMSRAGWSSNEKHLISGQHWWSSAALRATSEIVYPQNIADMLDSL